MSSRREKQREQPSTIRLAYWESLIALRSGGVRITLVVFSLLLFIAIVQGILRTQARQDEARLSEQENVMVKEIFHNVFNGTLDSVEATNQDSVRKDRLIKQLRMTAKSPYMVSHASNLWNVSLFPSPLSALSVGASSQSWPDRYRIHGLSLSKTVQRGDQIRPSTTPYGPFDVTFMIMAIAPLVVIGVTFNLSSHDQESNLQSLIIAQTPSLGQLMAVRCFVRAGLVILLVACIVNGTLLFSFASQFDFKVVLSLLVWNVVAAAYLLLWAAFSLFVNSFARSSLANGTALLLLWLILVLLIPKFASYAVEESVPTLPESELIERENLTLDDIEKRSDELLQRFQSKHPELEIDSDDEQQITLVKYLLNHREAGNRASENVSAHYSAQSLRASYLSYCAWLSPAISFRIQSDRSAGNSEPAFIAFSARVAEVQAQVAQVFLHPSIANTECTMETIAALPSFQESEIPKQPFIVDSILSLVAILVWMAALVMLGTRQFRARVLSDVKTTF